MVVLPIADAEEALAVGRQGSEHVQLPSTYTK